GEGLALSRRGRRPRLRRNERGEQRLAARVVGSDLEDALAHRDRLLVAALIAIRDRDRAVELDRLGAAPGVAKNSRDRHAQTEIIRLVLEPFLQIAEPRIGHDGVRDTGALKVMAGEVCGSVHLFATFWRQLSNSPPSDGADVIALKAPA